jgi:PAS domain S-box-containing protein
MDAVPTRTSSTFSTRPARSLAWWTRWVRPQVAILVAGAAFGSTAGVSGAWRLGAIVVGIVAGTLGVTWLIRRTRGLHELQQTAASLAEWTLQRDTPPGRLPVSGVQEFAPLDSALRNLAHRLSEQVKDAARQSRNLEALINALDEPVLATDNADRVLLCNRSAEALLGVEAGGLLGKAFTDLFTQDEVVEMHSAARRGETRRGRAKVVTPLGTRIMQLSAAPVPVAWGEGIFGAVMVMRDVTELAQAVQVKTDFVANASHELRTPVAAIRGAAETLHEMGGENPAMSARLVTMIQAHTQRLEEMLRDLLDLSRLESPDASVRREVVDLHDVARSLRQQFEHACTPRGLTLVFEIDDDLVGMQTDPGMVQLVLRNLVENAIKFAHDATTIRVRASLMEEEVAPQLGPAGAEPPTGTLRLEVEDQGVGIPLQHQDRVFERYYQVDPARTGTTGIKRGTGLGLAIVKHAAKSLGGRVGLHSVWGEGTRVWAEWPVTLEERA